MNTNDERLLDLRALVRMRFARDLRSLSDIAEESTELTLDDLLEALHAIYVNYLQQNTLLNNAGGSQRSKDNSIQEEINRLRASDES